ncbi:MAG: glycosyltransferase family 4 protein [Gaiellaceae bacterium]|jgi:phosphatidylinositol alpha-mannosyltransferase
MKVAIVVPYSWSFWGGVVDHAEQQLLALRDLGVDAWLVMGNDPPGSFTHVLHPGLGRHGTPPEYVLPVGRSVIVPANGSLPNIVLTPTTPLRMKRIFDRGGFDLIHVHEPMTPAIGVAALALWRGPSVATFHASGDLRWMYAARYTWGNMLADRIDRRIAVSPEARASAQRWLRGEYAIVPNGVIVPPKADPANREDHVVFIGRHEPRKGMHIMLRAWPEIRRRTGARLRLVGADPLAVRLVLTRERVSDEGIDVLGALSNEDLTGELLRAKVQVASSLGGESFGMVLTRGLACALPVVASDIPGYRAVLEGNAGVLVPPGDAGALAAAVVDVLADEEARQRRGAAARVLASERYAWDGIARRLLDIYEEAAA